MKTTFKAVLCDMDGTFVNTEEISHKGFRLACAKYNAEFSEQLHRDIMGTKSDYWAAHIVEQLSLPIEPPAFKELCAELEHDLIKDEIRLMDGFDDLLDTVRAANARFILVTSSRKASVERNLKYLGIQNPFDDWVTADIVGNGKPDPEPFLLGAQKAGAKPLQCISIEDSYLGVKSAALAGTRVFAVPGQYSKGADFSSADKVFDNLGQCAKEIHLLLKAD